MKISSTEPAIYQTENNTNHEDKIIAEALTILKNRLKTFGKSFTDPTTSKDYLTIKLSQKESEEFHVLFLTNQHQLIEDELMFTGTIDGCSIYPREIIKKALFHNAAAVIFAHNHPSGLCEPSSADFAITDKLKNALSHIDIRVLDHIVVAGTETYSFAEHGRI